MDEEALSDGMPLRQDTAAVTVLLEHVLIFENAVEAAALRSVGGEVAVHVAPQPDTGIVSVSVDDFDVPQGVV